MAEDGKEDAMQPIDPTMVKSHVAVKKAKADNSGRVYRVYSDGIFDMCHVGHMNMLKQAKTILGKPEKTYLLVGVCSDELTHKFKGKTVMNHQLRCDSIEHVRWCDQVVPEAPWVLTEEFLDKYKIDFIAHDALPYVNTSDQGSATEDVYFMVKNKGMFMETQRTEGISTSDLIVNIVKDYDKFVKRNLSRGYSKDQLQVGRTWEIRAKFHENEKKLDESIDQTKHEWREFKSQAFQFGKQFNPRRESFQLRDLGQNLKEPFEGVKRKTTTLRKSVGVTIKNWLWWINPFEYLSTKMRLIMFAFMIIAVLWQYFLYRHIPQD